MLRAATFTALIAVLACSSANAASLTLQPIFSHLPNQTWAIYLSGESTVFNGVGLSLTTVGGGEFLNVTSGNVAGVPRPAGDAFTYRNRLLDADPAEVPGGKGWNLLGVKNTPTEIAFNGGPIGQTISTASEPGGRLFLANVLMPPTAQLTVAIQLVNGVDTAFTERNTTRFFPSEPMSAGLSAFALIGGIAARRKLGARPA